MIGTLGYIQVVKRFSRSIHVLLYFVDYRPHFRNKSTWQISIQLLVGKATLRVFLFIYKHLRFESNLMHLLCNLWPCDHDLFERKRVWCTPQLRDDISFIVIWSTPQIGGLGSPFDAHHSLNIHHHHDASRIVFKFASFLVSFSLVKKINY